MVYGKYYFNVRQKVPITAKLELHEYALWRPLDDYYWHTWRRQWHPTPVLLPVESHGRRSLVSCSPWGHKESDTTERLHFVFSLSCIGEGNGNPLQCSCLENPRDEAAWWAAVHGVTRVGHDWSDLAAAAATYFSGTWFKFSVLIYICFDKTMTDLGTIYVYLYC